MTSVCLLLIRLYLPILPLCIGTKSSKAKGTVWDLIQCVTYQDYLSSQNDYPKYPKSGDIFCTWSGIFPWGTMSIFMLAKYTDSPNSGIAVVGRATNHSVHQSWHCQIGHFLLNSHPSTSYLPSLLFHSVSCRHKGETTVKNSCHEYITRLIFWETLAIHKGIGPCLDALSLETNMDPLRFRFPCALLGLGLV